MYKLLTKENWVAPWFNEVDIRPGQNWRDEIENAIDDTDVVIVFLSRSSASKEGFVRKEIRTVLDKSDEKPDGAIYIISLRVEECEVPKRFANLQWLDISVDNIEWYSRLRESLRLRAVELNIPLDQFDAINSLQSEVEKLRRTLEIKEIEIKAILAQAHEIANTDTITYLPNRRKILVDLHEEVIRASKYDNSLSIF